MILSDSAIFEALDDGRLVITPEPQPRRPSAEAPLVPFDRTSVNLRLGETLRIPRPNLAIAIDLSSGTAGPTLHALYDSRAIPDEGLVLDPNRFILGMTLESIRLPLPDALPPEVAGRGCLAARVEGKSSLARFGLLIHFTAPTIHAGFEGNITLEIMNLGPAPIRLQRGMPICQLILEPVQGVPLGSGGQFSGQRDPAGRR